MAALTRNLEQMNEVVRGAPIEAAKPKHAAPAPSTHLQLLLTTLLPGAQGRDFEKVSNTWSAFQRGLALSQASLAPATAASAGGAASET
jgi:hypothetical protein